MITYELRTHRVQTFSTRRWLFELSEEVRWDDSSDYASGRRRTSMVVVSWGRLGDTCIFPSNEAGSILDMHGFKSWAGWIPAEEALDAWLTELAAVKS
jgi:hypothetical protein